MKTDMLSVYGEAWIEDQADLRANYDEAFCAFVGRVARECDPEDEAIWAYWETENDDGTPCLHAGHFKDPDEIVIEYYDGLTEEDLDGNSVPSGYIHIPVEAVPR